MPRPICSSVPTSSTLSQWCAPFVTWRRWRIAISCQSSTCALTSRPLAFFRSLPLILSVHCFKVCFFLACSTLESLKSSITRNYIFLNFKNIRTDLNNCLNQSKFQNGQMGHVTGQSATHRVLRLEPAQEWQAGRGATAGLGYGAVYRCDANWRHRSCHWWWFRLWLDKRVSLK